MVSILNNTNMESAKEASTAILFNIAGICCYAFGMNCFLIPNQIIPGGASGIAVLLNHVTGWSMGAFVFLFNIPLLLLILVKKMYPLAFLLKTLASTAFLAVITDALAVSNITYQNDLLLAAVFGGCLMGTGLALVHMGGSNTGGISLLGAILRGLSDRFPVGVLVSLLNIVVVFASSIMYRNMESLLYALFTAYLSGAVMDRICSSLSTKELLIVISECTDKVRQEFLNRRKGITILKGEGGYSSSMQRVIICAADKKDCFVMQHKIKQIDQKALIIITSTNKVEGKGFEHLI